ncbi:MAG: type II toxin-antitoxin system RelE/ParE family toxin [Patescibacteria group bacterium]
MHQIVITPSAKRAAKKLPKNIRKEIINHSQKLKENPYLGEKLSSSLHFLYSFHVKVKGTEYRLAYTIDNAQEIVIIHLVGPRENFYEKLKRLFR